MSELYEKEVTYSYFNDTTPHQAQQLQCSGWLRNLTICLDSRTSAGRSLGIQLGEDVGSLSMARVGSVGV
jgi:hypothetical protein